MAYQLVLSGNRILAHGEAGCFLAMGGTVICEEKGKAYPNATVVTHEGGLPADIDKVGYEYHAGVFIPCAPYGTGAGDILVACEDCGTPKRSGYSSELLDLLENAGKAEGAAVLDENGQMPASAIPTAALADNISSWTLLANGSCGSNTLSQITKTFAAHKEIRVIITATDKVYSRTYTFKNSHGTATSAASSTLSANTTEVTTYTAVNNEYYTVDDKTFVAGSVAGAGITEVTIASASAPTLGPFTYTIWGRR